MSENQLRSVTNQDKVLKSRSIALRTEKERSRKIVSKPHQQSSILVMVSTFSCSTDKVHVHVYLYSRYLIKSKVLSEDSKLHT